MQAQVDLSIVFSILSLLFVIFGFVMQWFLIISKISGRVTAVETKCVDVVESYKKVVILETKMNVFWDSFTRNAVEVLKHPTEARMDELLDKLREKTIDLPELLELKVRLIDRACEKSIEAIAASLMIARIDVAIIDFTSSSDHKRELQKVCIKG